MANRPFLYSYLESVYSAFITLSNARAMGYASPEPIKISEINAYVSLMKITDQETREELVIYLQAMDECWMKIWHKNHKTSGSGKGSK